MVYTLLTANYVQNSQHNVSFIRDVLVHIIFNKIHTFITSYNYFVSNYFSKMCLCERTSICSFSHPLFADSVLVVIRTTSVHVKSHLLVNVCIIRVDGWRIEIRNCVYLLSEEYEPSSFLCASCDCHIAESYTRYCVCKMASTRQLP